MNSYFDHSSAGFYNPAHQAAAAAEAHQAYRSFSQTLSSLGPTASAYQSSRSNSATATGDSTGTYDAACKLYDTSSVTGPASAFKTECGIGKDQNGFKAPDQMTPTSAWNTAMRPSPSSVAMAGDPMRSFDAAAAAACSRSVTDAWSACCQSSTAAATAVGAPANAFYPWMAIAG